MNLLLQHVNILTTEKYSLRHVTCILIRIDYKHGVRIEQIKIIIIKVCFELCLI